MSPVGEMFIWGACDANQFGLIDSETRQLPIPQLLSTQKWGKLVRVACGYKHTLLLNSDGEVYSSGANEFGQLGRSDGSGNFEMIKALENDRIIDISCGAYHNAAISYAGRLYTWGCNLNGQLGRDGDDSSVRMVHSLAEHKVVQVSLGLEHSLVLTETSCVYVFGANIWGQLGLGFQSENPVPTPKQLMCLSGLPIRCIAAGGFHSLVITMSGSVFTWGSNKYGQLGLGPVDINSQGAGRSSIEAAQQLCVSVPTLVRGLKGMEVVYVTCGESHTVVLTRDGSVYTYGANHFGQLGQGQSVKHIPLPCQVAELAGSLITQIACGRMHTLTLLAKSGSIYGFGAGNDGQLGNNDFANSSVPQLVKGPWIPNGAVQNAHQTGTDLIGSFVVKEIYSGGEHACALVHKASFKDFETVSDFREWNPMSFRAIGTLCSESVAQIRNGLSAAALPAPDHRPESASSTSSSSHSMSSSSFNARSTSAAFSRIETIFSSLGCLAATCLSDSHFRVGREEHGVDLDGAHNLQQELFRLLNPNQLNRLITKLLQGVLNGSQTNYPSVECLRGFMVLLVSDLLNMPRRTPVGSFFSSKSSNAGSRSDAVNLIGSASTNQPFMDGSEEGPYPVLKAMLSHPSLVLDAFAKTINNLDKAPSKILDRWFEKMQPRYFKRLVVNLNNLIVFTLNLPESSVDVVCKMREATVRNALILMGRLFKINETLQHRISYGTFYIPEIKEKVNLDLAFQNWISQNPKSDPQPFSFYNYPFIFDAPTKAHLLSLEARLSMQEAMGRAQQDAVLHYVISSFEGSSPNPFRDSPFFNLTVRRDKLIQDTLTCLTVAKPSDLRKLLRVKFDGEEAVDEGGVLKEFFLLIMRDLLNPIYGMFRCYPESRMLWFNELTMESGSVFQLVGILCGLAIYNSIIVDLSFPVAMFRKFLGEKPDLDDLKELDPVVGRSLQQLLDYEGDDFVDVFCLNFSLNVDFFGENRCVELIENGANIPVTQENKAMYVDKYVDYVFNRSCEASYEAFKSGFLQVCSGRILHFFRPMELQSLVVGLEVVNWNELRQNTSYQGVYWDHHPVIEWFWEVLLIEFSVEDKKKFLRFLTGCDRVPIVGFSSLKITIQPNNSGDDYLPVAHTCANLLDLPLYSSKEVLAKKLALSIQQTEGFGLV